MSEQLRDKVFISYSHQDKKWLQRVESMLQPLVSKGKIITWVDRKDIRPGDQWDKEIKQTLASAKIAVLLVSEHFLASSYIKFRGQPKNSHNHFSMSFCIFFHIT